GAVMGRQWFFAHNGQTHGPVSGRQLKYLAATGGLQPEDAIWPEGSDPQKAAAAERALDFAALRRLAQTPRRRPGASKPPSAADEWPEWVDEMDALFRDPEYAVGPLPDWLQPAHEAPPTGQVPDWLKDVSGAEPSHEPEPTPTAPPPAA